MEIPELVIVVQYVVQYADNLIGSLVSSMYVMTYKLELSVHSHIKDKLMQQKLVK